MWAGRVWVQHSPLLRSAERGVLPARLAVEGVALVLLLRPLSALRLLPVLLLLLLLHACLLLTPAHLNAPVCW
jgi:hypothetical protein